MNKQIIKEWLKSTKIPLTVISRELNISRNTLYTWMKEDTDIRRSNIERILEVYGKDIKVLKGDPTVPQEHTSTLSEMERLRQIVELQNYKIKSLEEKLEQTLENQSNQITVTQTDANIVPPSEFHCKIEFKLLCSKEGVARQVKHFEGFQMIKKWLGYSKEQWLDILQVDTMAEGIMQSKIKCIYNKQMIEEALKAEEAMKTLYKNISNQTTNVSSSDKIVMLINKKGDNQPCRIYDNIKWATMQRIQFWHFVNGEDTV